MTENIDGDDAGKVYGALAMYEQKGERVTPEELNPPFRWGEYLEDCLDHLVEERSEVKREDGEYWIDRTESSE